MGRVCLSYQVGVDSSPDSGEESSLYSFASPPSSFYPRPTARLTLALRLPPRCGQGGESDNSFGACTLPHRQSLCGVFGPFSLPVQNRILLFFFQLRVPFLFCVCDYYFSAAKFLFGAYTLRPPGAGNRPLSGCVSLPPHTLNSYVCREARRSRAERLVVAT